MIFWLRLFIIFELFTIGYNQLLIGPSDKKLSEFLGFSTQHECLDSDLDLDYEVDVCDGCSDCPRGETEDIGACKAFLKFIDHIEAEHCIFVNAARCIKMWMQRLMWMYVFLAKVGIKAPRDVRRPQFQQANLRNMNH